MTTLMRWDPGVEVDSLQSEVNRIFDSFFGNGRRPEGARRWLPPLDLEETGDELVLSVDLPGLSEEDVAIEVKDDVLTISGKREQKKESGNGDYHRVERSYGTFVRSLSLPAGVDREAIIAHFDRGVLEVHIPKPEQRKPHRIEISAESKPTIDAGTNSDAN